METNLQLLQTIWFFLVGFLFIGYSVLDGFDLGIGTLVPFMAKDNHETATLLTAIGPVWDGNEVWLITAGGALFAAFPHVYASVFSGFYLAMMIILFALILRAVSLEFWAHDPERRSLWKWTFAVGSFLPSLLFGIALGNVIIGVPLNDKMEFTGDFFTLLRPFPVIVGLLGLSAVLLQGCSFALMKTEGAFQEKIRKICKWLCYIFLIFLVSGYVFSGVFFPESSNNPYAWICTALIILFIIIYRFQVNKNETAPFIMSTLSFVFLWFIAGSLQFPKLVRALSGTDLHMSIYNSSSSELTLTAMLVIALIGMPLVLGYTIYIYRIFKGKVNL